MTVTDFAASADLCGRRILLQWSVFPGSEGELAQVRLHRRERDFNFPVDASPHLLYDSATFPPAEVPGVLAVHPMSSIEYTVDGLRCAERVCSVARNEQGRWIETLRRTERTLTRADRTVARQDVELLDAGAGPDPLEPGLTYYYQLDAVPGPATPQRALATPTGVYRYHQTLYELLPAVYRRHDNAERPTDAGTGLWPEASSSGGQLRRLIDVFAATVGALRSSADGLRGLRDVDLTDARFLPMLAQWIGWQLTDDDIARQRAEITTAPGRYRTVGTTSGVRAIIEHHTGASVRVGEPAQNITLTNDAPQRNLFAALEREEGHWSGPDDAAAVLGIAGATSSEVTGVVREPFPLADGMSVWLSVDQAPPRQIRLAAEDFVDIAAAKAAEVCAVIGRGLRNVEATVSDGKLRLRSRRSDDQGRVAAWQDSASLVALDGAPGGRLAAVIDAAGVDWLAYATTAAPEVQRSRLLLKTRLRGHWYDARPIGSDTEAQADPALAALPDRLWCGWVSDPIGPRSMLRYRVGALPNPTPARLPGDTAEPFRLTADTTLTVTDSAGSHAFTVRRQDYADLDAATAAEVVVAFNRQRAADGPSAQVTPDGRLVLIGAASGPDVTMRVDLPASSTAWQLGFGARDLTVRGGWDPTVAWGPALDVPGVPAGRHADCAVIVESDGAVRLCWSMHDSHVWRLASSRWTDRVLAATSAGLGIISPQTVSTVTTANGLPSNEIRAVAVDCDGTMWLATGAGLAAQTVEGTVTIHTTASTAGGLLADDVRAVAAGPDGTVWVATAAGVSGRAATGAWFSFGTSAGLPSSDIRAVTVELDGTLWAATATTVVVRRSDAWQTIPAPPGAPTLEIRRLATGSDNRVWVASNSGLARIEPTGAVTSFDLAALGPGAADVRDLVVTGGTVWLATAAGVVEWRGTHDQQLHTGVGNDDCRAIAASDGEIWVGTGAGLFARGTDGRWIARAAAVVAVALVGAWSAPGLIGDSSDGERDPHLQRDGKTVLLAAARRSRTATGDTWRITLRRKTEGGSAWTPVTELTAAGAQDREPVITNRSSGGWQVFFRSNRAGGARIWRLGVSAAGIGSEPTAVTSGPSTETNPAVLAAGDTVLLMMRSDRNVTLSALAASAQLALPQQAAVRRFAGSGTAVPADAVRNATAGTFGELLDYTPNRPRGDDPAPTELYTPGTVAVYFTRGPADPSPGLGDPQRLRQLLTDYLPANVRVVTITDQ